MSQIVLEGDARKVLEGFPDGFFHMLAQSSPYYGLRCYGTEPQVWGGDSDCRHEWGTVHPPGYRGSDTNPGVLQHEGNKNRENLTSQTCSKCGAWKGEIGLEPTPEMFVEHLVEIAREAKRVLRDDGVMFWNIGDSFASNPGKGGSGTPTDKNNRGENYPRAGLGGCKPKDMIGIPWMLAFALRKDGWYLRSDLPWIKRNALPSSVTDRPSSSIEHVFLLAKSGETQFWTHPILGGTRVKPEPDYAYTNTLTREVVSVPPENWKTLYYTKENLVADMTDADGDEIPIDFKRIWKRRNLWDGHDYYYDHIATMQPSSESYNKDKRPRGVIRQCVNPNGKYPDEGQFKKQDALGKQTYTGFNDRYEDPGTGLRFMRDSDFFFRTWQGMLHNEDGEPMALVVNPKGYKGAHFACWPVRLVEVMIRAGTSEKGVCPECGAPWVRLAKKTFIPQEDVKDPAKLAKGSNKGMDESNGWGDTPRGSNSVETTGWAPSCSCNAGDPVPARVSDLFAGSCSTGVACYWNNRDFIGIELKHEYCELGRKRMKENK
jgi:hypothetical protein